MHKLYVNKKEIKHIGEITYSDDLETIANQIEFSCDKEFEVGSKFILMNDDKRIITGIITDSSRSLNRIFNYTGFDYGFYLNKNEVVIQFNKTPISNAIKQLCSKVNIPTGDIENINAEVTQIYRGKSVSDILFELLALAKKKTGEDYYFECPNMELKVSKYKTLDDLKINVGNMLAIGLKDSIGGVNISSSMQDLKNQILIIDNQEKSTKTLIQVGDKDLINKFGVLQEVEEFDDSSKLSHFDFANTMLRDLSKVKNTISLDIIGDDRIKKGVIIPINNKELKLDGNYLVQSSEHTISSTAHKIKVNLKKKEV